MRPSPPPTQSTLALVSRCVTGIERASQSVTSTSGTLITNTQRQEAAWTSSPPSNGPATVAIPVQAVQLPIAAARWRSEKVSMINARLLGTSSAAAMPWIARARDQERGIGREGAGHRGAPKPLTPSAKIRRRP